MKSVLISIKPKWCELIASGIKTIEVRKTKPKIDMPFKCYIYKTTTGKVIGEFVCSEITEFESEFWDDETYERIQTIIKDCERYFEFGECDYETVATNEDEKYKENWLCRQSCVSWEEIRKYVGTGITEFYGWHISELKIYDKPKELSEIYKPPTNCHRGIQKDNCAYCFDCKITRPPQSWCYVEEVQE